MKYFFFFPILFLLSCQNQSTKTVDYQHPIPFNPLQYVCHKTDKPLKIDGQLNEEIWKKTAPTEDFQDIQGNLKPTPPFRTYTKMLWDDTYFYFGVYLEEPHIWAKLTERDAVIFHDNDFEIFIDPDGDSHNYYEFEINALNTIWDLLLLRPYREDGEPKVLDAWDIRGIKTAVDIQGTLNNPSDKDSAWTIEIAIPWTVLEEMTPKHLMPKEGVQWRINFSRVQWHTDIKNGQYQKQTDNKGKNRPEENWVWSPQGYINMHAPETWGYVQFSEQMAVQSNANFQPQPDEKIKWALRQLYFQQRLYFEQNQRFTENLNHLTVPKVGINGYDFKPQINLTYSGYEIIAKSMNKQTVWIIREDGKLMTK